jgi:hypothetical protein
VTITRLAAAAVAVSLLSVSGLSGCSLLAPEAPRQTLGPDLNTPIEAGPFPEYVAEPLPEFERSLDPRITAAHDLIVANYEAIKAEDWAAACALYTDAYVANRIVYIADAPADSTCEEALELAYGGATEYIASFDEAKNAEGLYIEQQLMPYWYTPTEIAVDDAELTADNDRLVYSTSAAVYGNSAFAFKDDKGEFARPGHSAPWQTVATYFGLVDGSWKYIDTAEKAALD